MLILHTQGITLLMLTLAISVLLYEAANRAYKITGGDDGLQFEMGPVLGPVPLRSVGQDRVSLCAGGIVGVVHRRLEDGAVPVRPLARRHPPESAAHAAIGTPVWWRLVAIYSISAAMAGTAGALSAQTTRFVGLNTLGILISGIAVVMLVLGGTRRLYGAFLGAAIYVVVQDYAAKVNPFYWMFVDRRAAHGHGAVP